LNFDLGWNDYIHTTITPILTDLRTSLQSSLQNQAKQKANRKVTSLRSGVKLDLMKKLSTYLFLVLFSFSALSFGDDIRDYQIEGMSIGDSLLEYFSEIEIKKSIQNTQYPGSDRYIIVTFNDLEQFEIYSSVQMDFKKNDKKYFIGAMMGALEFENINDCYEKQKEIVGEIALLFPNAKSADAEQVKNFDQTGKSTSYLYEFYLSSGDIVQISCDDWSEEMTKTHFLVDALGVSLMNKEYSDFLFNEAY